MLLVDDKNLFAGRKKFRLHPVQKMHAFFYANLLYQEVRPQFPKDEDAIKEIIHLLANDPLCPVPCLSQRSIRRFLADAKGRVSPGQWLFKRVVNPDTGRESICAYENLGPRLKYPHPSRHRKSTHSPVE